MKKTISIIVAALVLTACAQQPESTETITQGDETTQKEEQTETDKESVMKSYSDEATGISFSYPEEFGEIETKIEKNSEGQEIAHMLSFTNGGHFLRANDPTVTMLGRGGYWGDFANDIESPEDVANFCNEEHNGEKLTCEHITSKNRVRMAKYTGKVDFFNEGPATTQYYFYNPKKPFTGIAVSPLSIIESNDVDQDKLEQQFEEIIQSISFKK